MMVEDGFIFAPRYISILCRNLDSLMWNDKLFMDWIRELVGKKAHDWDSKAPAEWFSPTDDTQKELLHTQEDSSN